MILFDGKDTCSSLSEREEYIRYLRHADKYTHYPHVSLVTCNRAEIYYGDGEAHPDTVEHLFRVTAGLESALLGETEIQHQVKKAYELASSEKKISGGLHRLFQKALKAGKRVRSETSLSAGSISHGTAVIKAINRERINIRKSKIVILGVNKLNQNIMKYLLGAGAKAAFISTRSYAKAFRMAKKFGAEAFTFKNMYDYIVGADILISATRAPHLIVKKDKFSSNEKLLIIDLAVPRDVDPEIGNVRGVSLYNIEDIESLVRMNRKKRKQEALEAEVIIKEEVEKYLKGSELCV